MVAQASACDSALHLAHVNFGQEPGVGVEIDSGRFLVGGELEVLLAMRHLDALQAGGAGNGNLDGEPVDFAGLGLLQIERYFLGGCVPVPGGVDGGLARAV